MKRAVVLGFFCGLIICKTIAQVENELPWIENDIHHRQPLAYEYVREADVMWSKYLWRTIDTRQKLNLPFSFPDRPLIEIIHEAAKKGLIKCYDASVENADQFKKVLAIETVTKIGTKSDTELTIDPIDLSEKKIIVKEELDWLRIHKWRVKEVWYFDTKLSAMQTRIIGLAPVMEDFDANGIYRGDLIMYWLYYPDLRNLLAKEAVYNSQNDKAILSWDDIFIMRKFQSYIYKESNVYDRSINEYATGLDAQLESERIQNHIREFEHDLWSY